MVLSWEQHPSKAQQQAGAGLDIPGEIKPKSVTEGHATSASARAGQSDKELSGFPSVMKPCLPAERDAPQPSQTLA